MTQVLVLDARKARLIREGLVVAYESHDLEQADRDAVDELLEELADDEGGDAE